MRTVILVGCMMIASSINQNYMEDYSNDAVILIAIILLVSIAMDIIDFIVK